MNLDTLTEGTTQMRQAILTKFIGPTNHRDARVRARCEVNSKTYPWRYQLGVEGNHIEAAKLLAAELRWDGPWVGGATENGYAFINAPNDVPHAFYIAKVLESAANLEEELA